MTSANHKYGKLKMMFVLLAAVFFGPQFLLNGDPYVIQIEEDPIVRVPKNYLGLSIEYPGVQSYLQDPKGGINYTYAQMIRNLTPNSNGAPTLRIGGASTDYSWWDPKGKSTPPFGITFNITEKLVDLINKAGLETHQKLILGLNMAQDNTDIAIDWAHAALKNFHNSTIIAFEIGNEPDLYGVVPYISGKFVDGSGNPLARPTTWSFNDYLADFDLFSTALISALPKARLAGQVYAKYAPSGFSPYFLISEPAFLQSQGLKVDILTQHVYPLNGCDPNNVPTISQLLSPNASDTVGQIIKTYANMGKPMFITELNSANCGGVPGVSDTFASTLWIADILFELLQAGVQGVNVTTSNDSDFTPFRFDYENHRNLLVVNPLYYGMLLFAKSTSAGAKLIPISKPANADPNIKIWAAIGHEQFLNIVVINKNVGTGRSNITLEVPEAHHRGRLQELLSPGNSPTAFTGITFAGQTYDGTTKGHLTGKHVYHTIIPQKGGFYQISIPYCSAAILQIAIRDD